MTEATKSAEPEVTLMGPISMQVCVPTDWPDSEVEWFSERENPCGTTNGWAIRREGDPMLDGDPERQPCADREGFVHIMLDA